MAAQKTPPYGWRATSVRPASPREASPSPTRRRRPAADDAEDEVKDDKGDAPKGATSQTDASSAVRHPPATDDAVAFMAKFRAYVAASPDPVRSTALSEFYDAHGRPRGPDFARSFEKDGGRGGAAAGDADNSEGRSRPGTRILPKGGRGRGRG